MEMAVGLRRDCNHVCLDIYGYGGLQNVTIAAKEMGVQVLTVYAFSTENWSRPEKEVKFIMNLPVEFYERYVPELHKIM